MSQFIVEARAGQFEYARVLADFTSAEENALQLSAGEIVAVVPKVNIWKQKCVHVNFTVCNFVRFCVQLYFLTLHCLL